MEYDFDKVINRQNTYSMKWDGVGDRFPNNPDAFPMWVADMDFECPKEVVEAVIERAKHPIYGYARLTKEYKEVAVEWLAKRHGWVIDPSAVEFCNGVVPALSILVNAFTKPGDKVIIQPPVYYPFEEVITNNGRFVLENPLVYNGEKWVMDFDDLKLKAKDKKAKLMILCNPHNPVGRVFKKEELIELGNICLENDILLISDEIHSDLVFRHAKHVPISSLSEKFQNNTITTVAPTKTFNIAGLQCSAIVIPNPKLRKEYLIQQRKHRTQNISIFGVVAFVAAYKYGEDYLEQLIDYLWDNYLFLDKYLKDNMPLIKCQEPEGTYLMWLDCKGLGLTFKELDKFFLNEASVALDNGIWFGPLGAPYMRMNIACPRSLLEEGLNRIKTAYDKLV